VKADDLVERLVEKALEQILSREPGAPPALSRAEAIAIGALRVYMTGYSRNKVIAFDFDEALAFEATRGRTCSTPRCGPRTSSASSRRRG
jgi:arginyl-tRNA synthetase